MALVYLHSNRCNEVSIRSMRKLLKWMEVSSKPNWPNGEKRKRRSKHGKRIGQVRVRKQTNFVRRASLQVCTEKTVAGGGGRTFSRRTFPLAAFERIAILGQNGIGNAAPDRDGIDRRVFGETAQNGELGGERIAIGAGCERDTSILLHVVHGVVNKGAGGITHQAGGRAFCRGSFLRATQARFHAIDVHYDIRQRAHPFLLVC